MFAAVPILTKRNIQNLPVVIADHHINSAAGLHADVYVEAGQMIVFYCSRTTATHTTVAGWTDLIGASGNNATFSLSVLAKIPTISGNVVDPYTNATSVHGYVIFENTTGKFDISNFSNNIVAFSGSSATFTAPEGKDGALTVDIFSCREDLSNLDAMLGSDMTLLDSRNGTDLREIMVSSKVSGKASSISAALSFATASSTQFNGIRITFGPLHYGIGSMAIGTTFKVA